MKDKLNIGCGYKHKEGFINIDKASKVKPNMVINIEEGLPFLDNTFIEIYSEHTLEHIRPEKWLFVLNEISRVAKPDCILHLILPFDNISTRTHFDHYRTFNWSSFDQLILGEKGRRYYYSKLSLKSLEPKPHKLKRWFFYFFNIFKNEIEFKFKIVKNG